MSLSNLNLGAIRELLSPFALSNAVELQFDKLLKYYVIGLGQGGGRICAEISRFGYDACLVNSATVDMREHDDHVWIKKKVILDDPDRGKIEGTAKNAALGHQLALKNLDKIKEVALDTQDADFVWVTVSLGGGTGNGALKTMLEWLVKVKELTGARTETGNMPIGVIASIPSRDESNPFVWQNAANGLKLLQEMINEKKIGSVLLVDNEKIAQYYTREPFYYRGKPFGMLDYSNIVIATSLFECSVVPVLKSQISMDTAELLEIFSTSGWLTLSKKRIVGQELDLEKDLHDVFFNNEILAELDLSNTIACGLAVITSQQRALDPKTMDHIQPAVNKILNHPSIFHCSLAQSGALQNETVLLGMAVVPSLPEKLIATILEKYHEEKQRKQEKEEKSRVSLSAFDQIENVYDNVQVGKRKKAITLEDLQEFDAPAKPQKKRITLDDLQ